LEVFVKKPWLGLVVVLISIVTPGFAQQPGTHLAVSPEPAAAAVPYGAPPQERTFFPHNWVRGHTDFELAPPHNEPDLGRCSQAPAAQFGGVSAPCTAYARWVLSGYIELQPFGRTFLRHIFLFYSPQFFFGRNVPRYLYPASFAPIMDERSMGVGLELPKNFELRLTSHRTDWLGRYAGNLGAADLGTDGTYGKNATIGLRWNFGGWGRSHESQ
jgi:hypothetical protein